MVHDVTLPDTFHGPLDLLLYLVRRDEIDIHDIPIAHVTREYLAALDELRDLDIDLAGDFVAMASMLMEIKSRMLLPPAEPLEGEEEEDFDPRAGLVQALLEYKRFKEAAAELGQLQEDQARRFERLAPMPDLSEGEITLAELGVADLFAAFNKMVRSLLTTEAAEIVSDEVSTEIRIQQVRDALAAAGSTRFSLLLSSEPTKGEMVGFFVALMELIRLREIRARQTMDFADIHIETRTKDPESRPAAVTRARSGRRVAAAPATLFAPAVRGSSQPLARQAQPAFPSARRVLPRTVAPRRLPTLFAPAGR